MKQNTNVLGASSIACDPDLIPASTPVLGVVLGKDVFSLVVCFVLGVV